MDQTLIKSLGLSLRTFNCLIGVGITKVDDVLMMSDEDLLKIRNFGDRPLEELHQQLALRGLSHNHDGTDGNGLRGSGYT